MLCTTDSLTPNERVSLKIASILAVVSATTGDAERSSANRMIAVVTSLGKCFIQEVFASYPYDDITRRTIATTA